MGMMSVFRRSNGTDVITSLTMPSTATPSLFWGASDVCYVMYKLYCYRWLAISGRYLDIMGRGPD